LERVVHLHRRAALRATWSELQRDLADGPRRSIDRLLAGGPTDEAAIRDVESLAAAKAQPELLRAAWVRRLWTTGDPLGEQLALMWHNHFATSNLKVQRIEAMLEQVATLRRLSRAPFGNLLKAMLHDAAMLVWLDADSNRRAHPNENLAREVMELFTLGVDNYSERDVQDAARALTGWTLGDGAPRFLASQHDDGTKTILGKSGRWGVDDLAQILLLHSATANRLAWRVCDHFLGPDAAPPEARRELAESLRASNLDIAAAVDVVLRSQLFFSRDRIGRRIAAPTSWAVATTRALELHRSGLSPELMGAWLKKLGQDLFHPPGVGGWPGGRTWLGAAVWIDKARFAKGLSDGSLFAGAPRADLGELARRNDFRGEPCEFGSLLLFGRKIDNLPHGAGVAELMLSTAGQYD
jgi:uncharacterized protein (DUF1800 family)